MSKPLDGFRGLLDRLIVCLNESGLDYAFTGAVAVSFYGIPRTTSDVDVMIAVASDESRGIIGAMRCAGLGGGEKSLSDALKSGYKIATFRDQNSPFEVDVILSRVPLEKKPGQLGELDTYFQSPENLIEAKLRMIKATIPRERTQKDEEDIRNILSFTKVDMIKVRREASREGTLDVLNDLGL